MQEYNERIESLQEKIDKDPSRRKAVFIASQYGREKDELEKVRPKQKICLFPVTCPNTKVRVGRSAFFFLFLLKGILHKIWLKNVKTVGLTRLASKVMPSYALKSSIIAPFRHILK